MCLMQRDRKVRYPAGMAIEFALHADVQTQPLSCFLQRTYCLAVGHRVNIA